MPYDRSKAIRVGDLVEFVGSMAAVPTVMTSTGQWEYIRLGATGIATVVDHGRDRIEVLCDGIACISSPRAWWRLGSEPPVLEKLELRE
jgi:hypothetical protein